MIIRKATEADIDAVSKLYADIHTADEAGNLTIGWRRGIYPERSTAAAAVEREDLLVLQDGDEILGSAIINQQQIDVYSKGAWSCEASDSQVMVLHTLTIAPKAGHKGLGRKLEAFYEEYAREKGCRVLRIDTNEINLRARAFYGNLGYREVGVVPCVFNGLEDVQLVLLEKKL